MKHLKNLSIYTFLTAASLSLTACGGVDSKSATNDNTNHPAFSWEKVAVSNNYSPSGDTTDLTPTFSWKAVSGASTYNFGHENTSGGEWKEYTVPAAEAGCATGSVCNYKPANHIFNEGEQKVWWVRASVSSQWQAWSDAHVFNVVDGSGEGNPTTPVAVSPKNAQIVRDDSPWFTWNPIQDAKALVLGLEKQDGTAWESYKINAKDNCPPTSSCPKTTFRPNKNFVNGDYTWWIRAEKQNGNWTNWSNGAEFTINAAGVGNELKALTPSGIISTTQPTFTWSKPSYVPGGNPDKTIYQVGFEANAEWKEFNILAYHAACSNNKCSYKADNTGLSVGDKTTWYIRAKINGVSWSEWTDGKDFSIEQASAQPTAPQGLGPTPGDNCRLRGCQAIRTYPHSYTMHWKKSTDSTVYAYAIYRDGVKIATKNVTLSSYNDVAFSDDTITLGGTNSYTVTAINSAGESAPSDAITATMPNADTQAPSIPTKVTVTMDSANDKVLVKAEGSSDTGSSRMVKYNIYRDGVLIGNMPVGYKVPQRPIVDETAQSNTTYSYTATAVDAAGNESGHSQAINFTVP